MADLLIKHLKKKSDDHSALSLLENQWGFDEKIIPKALQGIASLFPHYSRHDESHSKQILINIERLLGEENISKLTATDTWLILEAAYWHDIGMVVPHNDMNEAFNDPDFQIYINDIKNSPHHELFSFCQNFNSPNLIDSFNYAGSPLESMDKFRQLMAEWFRRKHADRANTIVNNPWGSAGISSPRTELIPSRLFKVLGRICHLHGADFNSVVGEGGLPYREAGMAQEDCHPRFVACLLRMGDLLDLDDNRFCPVMMKISGDNRPELSKAHEEKHSGIRHLRIDVNRIEVTSECATIESYLESFKWFDWLKKEMQDQMSLWQEIVPSRDFGLLPTLGEIKVELKGSQQVLKDGCRPQFGVDSNQAIKLLQGNNLYEKKFPLIRELLQNAVDATLLCVWLKNKDKITVQDDWSNPLNQSVQTILHELKIKISLVELEAKSTSEQESLWKLCIEDEGTGISRDDLVHMLNIGGSHKNNSRQELIESMPEWMKPSGTFGIGFQSVFLLADKVDLTTKSLFSNETLKISLYSPTGAKEGLVTLELLKNEISKSCGTKLEIIFPLEKFTSSYSISWGERNTVKSHILNTHDPVLDKSFPIESAEIADAIHNFSTFSFIEVKGEISTLNHEGIELGFPNRTVDASHNFVNSIDEQLILSYEPVLNDHYRSALNCLYRGQPFEVKNISFPFCIISVNILSGKAGSWLSINRDKLNQDARVKLKLAVENALLECVKHDLEKLDIDVFNSRFNISNYSIFVNAMAHQSSNTLWESLSNNTRIKDAWLSLEYSKGQSYKDLFSKKEFITGNEAVGQATSNSKLDVEFETSYQGQLIKAMVYKSWLSTSGNSIKVLESDKYTEKKLDLRYQFSKENEVELYSDGALISSLVDASNSIHGNTRQLIPVFGDFSELALRQDVRLRAECLFKVPLIGKKFILLPFLFCSDITEHNKYRVSASQIQTEKLCNWVKKNSENDIALELIKSKYEELIVYFDTLMESSPFADDWAEKRID
jgi:hypothetical protein